MSVSHHSSESERRATELQERFLQHVEGTPPPRRFGAGRLGAEDDGELEYAIASDQKLGVIMIRFPKPVDWIGLDIDTAQTLRDELTRRLLELRGIPA